jgi:hypothetical protein
VPQPMASWNPARGVWETTNVSLCGHSEPYSETWPTSGTTRAGRAYARPTSAPPTDGSGCSSSPGLLLGTPRTSSSNGVGQYEENPRGDRGRLEAQVDALLRTPTAQLAVNGGSQHPDKRKAGGHEPTLADEVEHLLPTPRATDGTKGGPNQRGSSGDLMLPSAVQLLPTPTAQDAGGSRNCTHPRKPGNAPATGTTLTDWAWLHEGWTGAPTGTPSGGGNE